MHIEPGVVQGAKLALSYGTAITSLAITAKLTVNEIKKTGYLSLGLKTILTSILVFIFFQVFPHFPVGVSEVHFIFGSTLFLLFGVSAASLGLAIGLLCQGVLFSQTDLAMYFVNITTLLMPLFVMNLLAKKVIPKNIAYKDLKYSQVLKLSIAYQGGIVAWVMFWAFYGQGFTIANTAQVLSFGSVYLAVILIEPLLDLGVLALAKTLNPLKDSLFVEKRLYSPDSI